MPIIPKRPPKFKAKVVKCQYLTASDDFKIEDEINYFTFYHKLSQQDIITIADNRNNSAYLWYWGYNEKIK